jgi:hypothetical protein
LRALLLLGLVAASGCITFKFHEACEPRSALDGVIHCSVRHDVPGRVSLHVRATGTSEGRYWDFEASMIPGASASAPGLKNRGESPLPGSSYTVLVAQHEEDKLLVRWPLERKEDARTDENLGPADLALDAILVEHEETVELWIPPRNGRTAGPDPRLNGPWVLLERDRYDKAATLYSTTDDEHVTLKLDAPEESYLPLFILGVPFTVILDVATSPIQLVLLIIYLTNARFM